LEEEVLDYKGANNSIVIIVRYRLLRRYISRIILLTLIEGKCSLKFPREETFRALTRPRVTCLQLHYNSSVAIVRLSYNINATLL